MNLADQMLLAQLRQTALSHVPADQWALIEAAVEQAGGIRETDGYAGTVLTKAIQEAYKAKNKVATVMGEFKEGKLRSSSGSKVTNPKQAIAIALSEQRRAKKKRKKVKKASFGGDRSAAGRYAAEQRWKNNRKGGTKPADSGRKAFLDDMGRTGEDARARQAARQAAPSSDLKARVKDMNLASIADEIRRDLRATGQKVPFGAAPYLDAMSTMDSINDNYFEDSGASIVAYLLGNLSSYKGETARIVKAELNRRFKETLGTTRSNVPGMAKYGMGVAGYVASGKYREDRKAVGARPFGTLRRPKKKK